MNRSDIWEELRHLARKKGTAIITTMLGKVPHTITEDGEFESLVPKHLAIEASVQGFDIVRADFKSGSYELVLRKDAPR